ncbi:hypothetical protein [Prosthecobacter sp.]|uniref:hypothetical protein n=1 Tax=Prosthecobacter sp. TaxID=1965333 RepID=UPI00378329B1
MRVRPSPHKLEIRFTFNILTLSRFTGIDTDGDHKISMAELTAAQPRIATYLNQHILVEINQKKASLGTGVRFEPLWPDAAQTPPMTEPEYAAQKMDVTFVQTIADKVLEDFWLGFEIFEQTGPMQTIRGVFEQDGRILEVPFSVQDPEYLYDTTYADDPFLQEAAKENPKDALTTPPAEAAPTQPAARLATASPYAAPAVGTPAVTAPAMPAATVASPPAGNSAAKLAVPSESAPPPAPRSDERWWMIRAAVLMILLVVGRKLQLSARARRVSTRRPRPR